MCALAGLVLSAIGCRQNVQREQEVKALLQQLALTSDHQQRIEIRRKISAYETAAVLPTIEAVLSEDQDLAAAAMWAVLEFKPSSRTAFVQSVARVLQDASTPIGQRRQAAVALGHESEEGLDQLVDALSAPEPEVRAAASWGIYCTRDKSNLTADALLPALQDSLPRVRLNVTEALSTEHALVEDALPDLILLLDDEDSSVNLAAMNAIVSAGERAIPHVVDALRSESLKNSFRLAPIFQALGDAGTSSLCTLLENEDKNVVVSTLGIIQTIGQSARRTLPHVRALQSSEDADIRWFATATAAQLRD